ncbi:MAG: LysR family transcriptional regulator, partial [Pirellulaceae bacterium]|nr:LysR family transcriptional regulator [Pirellulaceae bacterium]
FWVVSKEGSVAKASEKLHVTPATISIQLRDLEKSLGVKLFRKAGRGLALTEMGMAVQADANEIVATGQELMDMVNGRPVGGPMILRVGIKDVMPKLVAYQLLEPTLRVSADIRLLCYEGDVTQLISDLAIHKLDVVLSDTPIEPTMKVRAYSHLLGESDVVLVGTKALAKSVRNGFPGSLNGAPVLLPMRNSVLRRSLDYWFEANEVRPKIVGEFDDSAMLKIMGKAGVGIFAVASAIRSDVEEMYGVEFIAAVSDVTEKFYALSVERKVKHPAVLAISEVARKKLSHR